MARAYFLPDKEFLYAFSYREWGPLAVDESNILPMNILLQQKLLRTFSEAVSLTTGYLLLATEKGAVFCTAPFVYLTTVFLK